MAPRRKYVNEELRLPARGEQNFSWRFDWVGGSRPYVWVGHSGSEYLGVLTIGQIRKLHDLLGRNLDLLDSNSETEKP